jgi:hypothetical protein
MIHSLDGDSDSDFLLQTLAQPVFLDFQIVPAL